MGKQFYIARAADWVVVVVCDAMRMRVFCDCFCNIGAVMLLEALCGSRSSRGGGQGRGAPPFATRDEFDRSFPLLYERRLTQTRYWAY